jgi:drug/metabolite transporter (DMT)-like permease
MRDPRIPFAVIAALLAAMLFGASTPLAKALLGSTSAAMLAGLLYLGSGIGLTLVRFARDRGWTPPRIPYREWPWLAGAIASGGIAGPLLLMNALLRTTATAASLLLNLEAVFTALLAWFVFRENADRRVVLGMALIVAGGAVLAWPVAGWSTGVIGPALVALACLAWAIDNNLTRKVSTFDALFIAAIKGWIAGIVNLIVAITLGARLPPAGAAAGALLVGFLGYGASLALFVVALRGLGSARTGAYFSTAPFIGAAVAIVVFGEPSSAQFWIAAACMAAGVWLHLAERHEHKHTHAPVTHTHRHVHDEHHQHAHAAGTDTREPHVHEHRHEPITHTHAHYPDVHHRHEH